MEPAYNGKNIRFPGLSFIYSFQYVGTGLLSVSCLTTLFIGMFT
jgi:hypothetical protein